MPFKSEAQRRFMFSNHPQIAKRWAKEYPNQDSLPQHVEDSSPVTAAKPEEDEPKSKKSFGLITQYFTGKK